MYPLAAVGRRGNKKVAGRGPFSVEAAQDQTGITKRCAPRAGVARGFQNGHTAVLVAVALGLRVHACNSISAAVPASPARRAVRLSDAAGCFFFFLFSRRTGRTGHSLKRERVSGPAPRTVCPGFGGHFVRTGKLLT